jgi:hypothetical protein
MTPPPPPLWNVLTTFWGLSERQTRQSWTALYRASGARAAGWRQTLAHFEGQRPALRSRERVWDFVYRNVMPATVVGVLEALIEEGLLSRQDGGQIEECILACVGREGDWAQPHGQRREG